MSWARFINIVEDIARLESGVPKVISAFRKMFDLWYTYLRYEIDSDCEPGHFLEAFDDFDCADGRDRIFALLSLNQGKYAVKPDYTVDTQEVYTKFAEENIRKGRLMWVLTQAVARMNAHRGDLPSYSPDWRNAIIRRPHWDNHHTSINASVELLENGKGYRIRTFHHCMKPLHSESPYIPKLTVQETQSRVLLYPMPLMFPQFGLPREASHFHLGKRMSKAQSR
jgi:hypothetical protein